jgi:osmotically-inducible protein OsmY
MERNTMNPRIRQLTLALSLMAMGANAQNSQAAPAAPVQRVAPTATPGTQTIPGLLPGQLPSRKTVPNQRQRNGDQRNFPPPDVGTNGPASVPRAGAGTNMSSQSPTNQRQGNGDQRNFPPPDVGTNGPASVPRAGAGTNMSSQSPTNQSQGNVEHRNFPPPDVGTNGPASVPRAGAGTNTSSQSPTRPFNENTNGEIATTNGFNRDATQFAGRNQRGSISNSFGTVGNQSRQFGSNAPSNVANSGANRLIQDQGTTAQDQTLLAQIRQALLPDILRERVPIHLIAQNGVVTMVGFVPNEEKGQEFVNLVQRTPGVVSVVNNLHLAQSGAGGIRADEAFTGHDRELLGQVRGEMTRRHSGAVATESVHLVSRDGVVTLSGFVSSAAEEQSLLAAAQSTPGVVQVVDNMRVRASGTLPSAAQAASAPSVLSAPTNGNINASSVGTTLSRTSRSNAPSSIFTINTNSPGLSR